MLKKENRLTKIGSIFQKRIDTPLFSIKIGKNNLKLNRFAFIVSKRVDSRAVIRNKTRRKTRAVIEEILNTIPKGNDFAFYIKKESISARPDEIRKVINKVFKND